MHPSWEFATGIVIARGENHRGWLTQLPSGELTQQWKITIFNGKIHYKWQFSIAMLVHQRVYQSKDYILRNGMFSPVLRTQVFDHLPAEMHIQVMSHLLLVQCDTSTLKNISLRLFEILKSAYILFLLVYSIELLLFSTLSYPKKRKPQIQFNC